MINHLNVLEKDMLRIRLVEESIADKYSEQKMRCPTHLSIGQEAISIGVCANLSNQDFLMSTHRAHAHYLAKGGNLKAMLAEIYGKRTGCSGGMGGSMHLIDKSVGFMGSTAIVGNTIPVAVGLGMSLKIKKQEHISCVFFGDGAVEEGVFYESINFALVHKLPVLFICENNLYSVYSGLEVRQPKDRKIFNMAQGMGICSYSGDGNNVEEVYEMTRQAKNKILSDEGPQLLEFSTYRWREHCGPNYDNHIGYRDEEEFLNWKEKDPLKALMLNDEKLFSVKKSIVKEITEAHEFAEESSFPSEEDYLKLINLKK
jgi:TPP-dependent pyruvate/acetoin dehydrogenase alpha subunit